VVAAAEVPGGGGGGEVSRTGGGITHSKGWRWKMRETRRGSKKLLLGRLGDWLDASQETG